MRRRGTEFKPGDRLHSGPHAGVVRTQAFMQIPENVSFEQAAYIMGAIAVEGVSSPG
jgi:hypothetical protein